MSLKHILRFGINYLNFILWKFLCASTQRSNSIHIISNKFHTSSHQLATCRHAKCQVAQKLQWLPKTLQAHLNCNNFTATPCRTHTCYKGSHQMTCYLLLLVLSYQTKARVILWISSFGNCCLTEAERQRRHRR